MHQQISFDLENVSKAVLSHGRSKASWREVEHKKELFESSFTSFFLIYHPIVSVCICPEDSDVSRLGPVWKKRGSRFLPKLNTPTCEEVKNKKKIDLV
jgi:hypothetical protein